MDEETAIDLTSDDEEEIVWDTGGQVSLKTCVIKNDAWVKVYIADCRGDNSAP